MNGIGVIGKRLLATLWLQPQQSVWIIHMNADRIHRLTGDSEGDLCRINRESKAFSKIILAKLAFKKLLFVTESYRIPKKIETHRENDWIELI